MLNKKKKIITAMSGGVDSSIAAALLKNKGHEVVGLFLLMGNNQNPKDAKKVAKKLNISLKILDVRKEFKKKVVDYLIKEYKEGRTPNPCVECNRWIKFRFLMEKALALKADYVATGHYARIKFVNSKQIRYSLMTAKDKIKDQTYFLWTLKQKQLKKVLFPIGDYTKTQIRAMAKKWDLPVFEKKESQEICFIPDGDIRRFLKRALPAEALAKAGAIITTKGEKIGEHQGLAYYTIGQRKGIKIGGIGPASTRRDGSSLGGPFYVADKDFKRNVLIVGQGDFDEALFKKEMIIKGVNWTCLDSRVDARRVSKPKFPLKCKVKIRYLTKSVPCIVSKIQNTKYKVLFDKKQRAVTPGQSAVFYKGNEVLGGGIMF